MKSKLKIPRKLNLKDKVFPLDQVTKNVTSSNDNQDVAYDLLYAEIMALKNRMNAIERRFDEARKVLNDS